MQNTTGFTIELLLISDDQNNDVSIRQSALIHLKNIIQEHCEQQPFLPQADTDTLKASILEGSSCLI